MFDYFLLANIKALQVCGIIRTSKGSAVYVTISH